MKEVLSLAMEKDLHVHVIMKDDEISDIRKNYKKYEKSSKRQHLGYTVRRSTHYLMHNADVVCMGDVDTMVQAIYRFKPTPPKKEA